MSIGALPKGERPKVDEHDGNIAIWVSHPDEEAIGVMFEAESGFDVGMDCLNIASRLNEQPVPVLQTKLSVEDNVKLDEDVAARLLITVEDVPFEITLTATQVCELAATFTSMAKRFDLK